MTRTDRIALAVGLALMAASLLLPLRDPPPLETGGYLQAVTTDSAVVAWTAAKPRRAALEVRCYGTVVFEQESLGAARRHEIAVTGLEPALEYDWTLRSDGAVIDSGRFRTRSDRDEDPVRFVVLGDSGGQPWWIGLQCSPLFHDLDAASWMPARRMPTLIGRAIAAERPDFWLHVGDVVYPAGELRHYRTGFFEPFRDALRDAACYPILGNHDVMTGDGSAFLSNFVLPGGDDHNFAVTDGPLRIIALDLNDHALHAEHEAIRFLRRELEAATEPWILVANHYPVRSVYREKPRADMLEHFVPLCREYGVDLLLSGHDHLYQRFGKPGELIEVVTGGGGKSLYEIRHEPEGFVTAALEYHYCTVEIRGLRLRLVARSVSGAILDEFVIDKREPVESGALRGRAERIARLRALGE